MLALIDEKQIYNCFDSSTFLSTYKIQDNLKIDVKTKIEKIIIENNFIIEEKNNKRKSFIFI